MFIKKKRFHLFNLYIITYILYRERDLTFFYYLNNYLFICKNLSDILIFLLQIYYLINIENNKYLINLLLLLCNILKGKESLNVFLFWCS